MIKHLNVMAAALMLLAGSSLAAAADLAVKSVTLQGTLECSKCTLHETPECGNVLMTKEGTEQVEYYLVDNALSKADHTYVCTTPKAGVTVTGTVENKGGKKWLTAAKIEFPK
jgi:hypothetical protein